MVDIQSATAEIRQGKKKEEERKKPQGKNIMSASAMQGGHNKGHDAVQGHSRSPILVPIKSSYTTSY